MEEEIIYKIKVDGEDKLKKIADETSKAADATKDNTDALNKQSAALDNTKFGGVVNGFKSMTTAAKAFIATPIGAVIGALGLALAALTSYFKGSEEGQNNFNKIVRSGTIILGNLLDIVRDFGGALFKVFTGDFKGAAEDLRAGFDGIKTIVEDTNAELEKGAFISALEAETDVLERQLIVLKGVNEGKIAKLKLDAEDKSLSNAQRQAALNEALRLQNELSDKQVQVAKNRLTIVQETNKLSDSTKEDLLEEAQLTAALGQVEKERNDRSKEIFTKNQQLRQEAQKQQEEEEAAAAQTRLALLRAERAEQLEIEHSFELQKFELKTNFNQKALADTKKLLAANIKAGEEETKARKAEAAIQEVVNQNKIQGILSVVRLTSGLAKENTILAKITGIAQATIDTYVAANRAFAAGGGVPFGTVLASLTVASGLANVAKISGIAGFASGGLTGKRIGPNDGTPITRSNGDNLLATVKTGEVILNERQQAMLGGARTFARLGVPGFAGGGLVASSSEARKSQNQLAQAIAGMNVVVTVEDINAGFDRVDTINKMAQVV